MTREEAARVLTELADEYEKYELSKKGWLGTTYIPAHRMGVAALRDALQRQPDPDTGLVPCGCGGKATRSFSSIGCVVFCASCGLSTKNTFFASEAVEAWSVAMGQKGGAE